MSDHVPFSVEWSIGEYYPKSWEWCFNNFLLEASGLEEKVRSEINIFFFCWNQGSTSVSVLWDAFKAYIFDILIALCQAKKRRLTEGRFDG